jgi:two-component system, NarL family, response regulator NreC
VDGCNGDGAGSTIVLADDHPVVRRGLRILLEEAGFEIVAEAADIAAAMRKVRAYRPRVLVLDLSMPGGSGLAAIPTFREISTGTAVVVLTMNSEARVAREALLSGASAFVLKEDAEPELIEAIRAAVSGHSYLSPRLGAWMAAEPPPARSGPDGLTDRELEVLKLVALGQTNREIARQLYLAERTIESHRSHVQSKIGRVSRVELVAYALEHGLIAFTASNGRPQTLRRRQTPTLIRPCEASCDHPFTQQRSADARVAGAGPRGAIGWRS